MDNYFDSKTPEEVYELLQESIQKAKPNMDKIKDVDQFINQVKGMDELT